MLFPDSDYLTPGSPIFDAITHLAPHGIVCLADVSSGGRTMTIDTGSINREMVLANEVVFGSVNANRRHYDAGAKSLADADPAWLDRLITRRVPLDHWQDAVSRRPKDVKSVILLGKERMVSSFSLATLRSCVKAKVVMDTVNEWH